MQLPIDFSNGPIKPKYLESETEATCAWCIFGEFPDGTVGICDGDRDIFDRVPRETAEKIVAARNEFVERLVELCR